MLQSDGMLCALLTGRLLKDRHDKKVNGYIERSYEKCATRKQFMKCLVVIVDRALFTTSACAS